MDIVRLQWMWSTKQELCSHNHQEGNSGLPRHCEILEDACSRLQSDSEPSLTCDTEEQFHVEF